MHFFLILLDLPNMVQRAATHIARKAVEMDIVPGRSPISVAAAAIYMASQVKLDQYLAFINTSYESNLYYRLQNKRRHTRKLVI